MKTEAFLFCAMLVLGGACRTNTDNIQPGSFESGSGYTFYPLNQHYTWYYLMKQYDSSNALKYSNHLTAVYSRDSTCINYFLNGKLYQAIYWQVGNQGLFCCGKQILLDFGEINSSPDSFMISKDTTGGALSLTYQYKKKTFSSSLPLYNGIQYIKTCMFTSFKDGRSREIIRFFGASTGLLYTEERYYSKDHKLSGRSTTELLDHVF